MKRNRTQSQLMIRQCIPDTRGCIGSSWISSGFCGSSLDLDLARSCIQGFGLDADPVRFKVFRIQSLWICNHNKCYKCYSVTVTSKLTKNI